MSSPATIPRTFINMSSSPMSPIDLTISPMSAVIIISDTEDEIDSSHNRNNSNYRLNDNNNLNSTLGFDNQNIFNSSRHSNNNQDSSSRNTNHYNRSRLAYSSNGDGSNRSTSTRSGRAPRSSIIMLNFTMSSQANNNSHRHLQHHPSAFHPYDIHYGNSSSGSSRTIPPVPSLIESARTNTNTNDVQTLGTPPPSSSRRRTNNSPKPTTLAGHARDLDDSHTLVCADCNELLHEKLWALSSCGHVVCGSCVEKYLEKKRFVCPSCKKTTKSTTLLQLYV